MTGHTETWRPGIAIACMAATVISASTLVGAYLYQSRASAVALGTANFSASVSAAALSSARWLREVDTSVGLISHEVELTHARGQDIHAPGVVTDLRDRMIQQIALHPSVVSMSIFDEDGRWTVSSRFSQLPPAPYNPRRPIWNAAVQSQSGRSFILQPNASPAFDVESIVLGKAIGGENNRLIGIATAFVSTDALRQPFSTLATQGREVMLVRQDGAAVMSFPGAYSSIPQWLRPQWSAAIRKGGDVFEAVDLDGQRQLVVIRGSEASLLSVIAFHPVADITRIWGRNALAVLVVWLIGTAGAIALFTLWLRQSRKTWLARTALLRNLTMDPATRLLNAAGLRQHLNDLPRDRAPREVVLVGIDRLQTLIDTLGHAAVEDLAAQMTNRLRSIVDPADLLARLGTKEFCIARITDQNDGFAQRMITTLAEPYSLGERDVLLGVSVGLVAHEPDKEWGQILQDGTIALHRARRCASHFCRFDPSTDTVAQDELMIEQELRGAIGTDQLYMVYQPVMSLHSGCIVGFEALMRWDNPNRGNVPPTVFIPIAERSGLLLPVERMVRRSPIAAAASWPDEISVSINCPALELRDPGLPDRMLSMLSASGVDPSRCIIELTETAMLEDDEIVLGVLNRLRQDGIRLAIDDFGTGHASLSYLHRFPFDRLKIDKSFVQAMENNAGATAIVEAAIGLGKRLGIEVVAEGVETEHQLQRLKDLGSDCVQGYLISKPISEEVVRPFLQKFRFPIV